MSSNAVRPSRVPSSPLQSSSASAEADADAQQLVQLVNRFVLSSVQFLNRFAEECESKLVRCDASLQQLELQTQLLEHMLLSSGVTRGKGEGEAESEGDGAAEEGASTAQGSDEDSYSDAAQSYESIDRRRGGGGGGHRRRRRTRSRGDDSVASSDDVRRHPPPPRDRNGGRSDVNGGASALAAPPAAPGAYRKGPPRPPAGISRAAAAAEEEAAARAATLAIVGATVLLPPPAASGEAPAPPPPLELRPGRFSMRVHPRLKGYFELLALRVPAAFVKAKMQADGYQGEWLDTPDAPAPATLSTLVREFADEPD